MTGVSKYNYRLSNDFHGRQGKQLPQQIYLGTQGFKTSDKENEKSVKGLAEAEREYRGCIKGFGAESKSGSLLPRL